MCDGGAKTGTQVWQVGGEVDKHKRGEWVKGV